ncbi:MAG: tryptophan synthase subunit alpha [Candidatus Peregrinibacteria bacterium]|nr:tryptophan synthase subunit alpha [Candidatus Peregrinibacteria bacterium]
MSRYENTFAGLKKEGRIGFVPFWMIGDPDIERSFEVISRIAKHADVLELGIPFSDPLADGPTIQASVNRALETGATTDKCLGVVKRLRAEFPEKPIGLLVYFNLILNFNGHEGDESIKAFFETAKDSGVDSVLIPELPVEEVALLEDVASETEIDLIFLVSTNTSADRVEQILKKSNGFLYAISTPSITGAKTDISSKTLEMVKNLKSQTDLPICVGFGISSPEHIANLKSAGADGAIIGSKLFEFRDDLEALERFCEKCREVT